MVYMVFYRCVAFGAGETFEMINSKLGAEPDCFSTPNGALGAILRGG
ncbi:MAG: hypothetical protein ACJAXG_000768 [Celeribacter sp.]|jgi:hypothetical protein